MEAGTLKIQQGKILEVSEPLSSGRGVSSGGLINHDNIGPDLFCQCNCFGFSLIKVFAEQFAGGRAEIREASRERALAILREEIGNF